MCRSSCHEMIDIHYCIEGMELVLQIGSIVGYGGIQQLIIFMDNVHIYRNFLLGISQIYIRVFHNLFIYSSYLIKRKL